MKRLQSSTMSTASAALLLPQEPEPEVAFADQDLTQRVAANVALGTDYVAQGENWGLMWTEAGGGVFKNELKQNMDFVQKYHYDALGVDRSTPPLPEADAAWQAYLTWLNGRLSFTDKTNFFGFQGWWVNYRPQGQFNGISV